MEKKAFRFGVVSGGYPSRSAWIALAQRVVEPLKVSFRTCLGTALRHLLSLGMR